MVVRPPSERWRRVSTVKILRAAAGGQYFAGLVARAQEAAARHDRLHSRLATRTPDGRDGRTAVGKCGPEEAGRQAVPFLPLVQRELE